MVPAQVRGKDGVYALQGRQPAAAAPALLPQAALTQLAPSCLPGAEANPSTHPCIALHTPADSWRFRAFGAAATGLLRPTLLRFYARATEHTRRLTAVEANAKFGDVDSGPDSGDLNVSCF